MNTDLTKVCKLAFGIGAIVLCFISIALYKIESPVCPPGKVCIDQQRISCFAQDVSADRWLPSSPEQRHFISAKVADKKAEYLFQSGGVDCYELNKYFILGDRVVQLPVEWYRPTRRKR